MKRTDEFNEFLNELITVNNLNPSIKRNFLFLPYKEFELDVNLEHKFVVFEDWWHRKPEIVKSKLKSVLQLNNRIYGRECRVKKITKTEADVFFQNNHIYGYTNSKIKYGLLYRDELFAAASFAGQRLFYDGSRSAELLRICNKVDYTIVGGTDKLLQAYIRDYYPDSIMTYIDLDWGSGNAFLKLGFGAIEKKEPLIFYVNKHSGERIPEKYFKEFENIADYVKVRNKGSLKMIKKI